MRAIFLQCGSLFGNLVAYQKRTSVAGKKYARSERFQGLLSARADFLPNVAKAGRFREGNGGFATVGKEEQVRVHRFSR